MDSSDNRSDLAYRDIRGERGESQAAGGADYAQSII
jgi:hypothetical protein